MDTLSWGFNDPFSSYDYATAKKACRGELTQNSMTPDSARAAIHCTKAYRRTFFLYFFVEACPNLKPHLSHPIDRLMHHSLLRRWCHFCIRFQRKHIRMVRPLIVRPFHPGNLFFFRLLSLSLTLQMVFVVSRLPKGKNWAALPHLTHTLSCFSHFTHLAKKTVPTMPSLSLYSSFLLAHTHTHHTDTDTDTKTKTKTKTTERATARARARARANTQSIGVGRIRAKRIQAAFPSPSASRLASSSPDDDDSHKQARRKRKI